jgi:hypothetical protein
MQQVADWAAGYPCTRVAERATQAAAGALQPSSGARGEPGDSPSSRTAEDLCVKLAEQAAAGLMYGPCPSPVSSVSQELSLLTIKRESHDSAYSKVRLCADLSKHGWPGADGLLLTRGRNVKVPECGSSDGQAPVIPAEHVSGPTRIWAGESHAGLALPSVPPTDVCSRLQSPRTVLTPPPTIVSPSTPEWPDECASAQR